MIPILLDIVELVVIGAAGLLALRISAGIQ
jgi:hypothetical protein